MRLVPFSHEYLRLDEALPFGVRDAEGRLLLAAGAQVGGELQLSRLRAQTLFADEAESAEWRRRLAAAMDSALRHNAPLKTIAAARPEGPARDGGPVAERTLGEQWEALALQLDAALRDASAEPEWLPRITTLYERALHTATRRLDASLYHLIYTAGHTTEKYSAHHALLSMVVCAQAAPLLGWPQDQQRSLGLAALTMNVAMLRLQDQLAQSDLQPTAEMRAQIDRHALAGEQLLCSCGVQDPTWLTIVRLHHEAGSAQQPLAQLEPAAQMARLLRRVDLFCAKISRRRRRPAMSPVMAARGACLGADGKPDEIGSALLKAVGLYPPGSFVELASGELGIVVSRGRSANLPLVATLVAASGSPMGEPTLRDTVERRHAVRGAVPASAIKVLPPHERLLALR